MSETNILCLPLRHIKSMLHYLILGKFALYVYHQVGFGAMCVGDKDTTMTSMAARTHPDYQHLGITVMINGMGAQLALAKFPSIKRLRWAEIFHPQVEKKYGHESSLIRKWVSVH